MENKTAERDAMTLEQCQRLLAQSEARFNAIVMRNCEGILIVDAKGIIRFVNPSAKVLLNRREDALIGKLFGVPIVKGEKVDIDIIRKVNHPGFAEMRVEKTIWEGAEAYLILILDITNRKNAENNLQLANESLEATVQDRTRELVTLNEQLRKTNKELEEFVYVASHDLQEPLRAMTSFIEILSIDHGDNLDPDAKDLIARAGEGARQAQTMIKELLDYGRINSMKKPQIIDLSATLKRILEMMRNVVETGSVQITYDPMPVITADDIQLGRLFQNLLSNAIKFRRKDVPLKIHISAEERSGEWVISVKDNGIGIDPKHKEQIFRIFQRLHTRTEYPGTGVGLAVCKKIVEAHGGKMWIESEAGNGSIFYFSLPMTPLADSPDRANSSTQ